VLVTALPGESSDVFVVEQRRTIRIVRNGATLREPFLDIRDRAYESSESGLLSLAFSPDYAVTGLFYVFYNRNAGNGDITISEWRPHPIDTDRADPFSERVLLTIEKPWENHNGGMLQFGPDGLLYASAGDGDSGVHNKPGAFVRDKRLRALQGRYLYGDFCLGGVTALAIDGGEIRATDDLGVDVPRLASFGVDGLGRVYLTSVEGEVWRLDPVS
jgi:hypothetical protein